MLGAVAVRVRRPTLLRDVGLDDESKSKLKSKSKSKGGSRPLSFPKPSWVVKTESNVRKLVRKRPDPPCVVCHGSGRVHCHHCSGQGRTNHVESTVLPKGEWPKWCSSCGGSGLSYCSRCLGTGEYRYLMGFHFMKMDSAHENKHPQGPQTASDPFLQGPTFHADHDI
ncbi:hypothetical protein ACOSQ4_003756 [Xanthoceras sorbifolium]